MRILIISQYFSPESFRINEIVSSLTELGHHVHVLTGKPNYPEGTIYKGYNLFGFQQEVYKNARIHRVPIIPRGRNKPFQLVLNYLSFVLSASIYVITRLFFIKFDIVFVYMPSPFIQAIPAVILSTLRNIPLVLNIQDLWPESLKDTNYINNKFLLGSLELVVGLIYSHANLVLVSSRPFVDCLSRFKLKCPVMYFPNSVDPCFLNPSSAPPSYIKNLTDGFKLIYAGNLGKAQSVYMLTELARKVKSHSSVKILVFGSGSELEWLRSEALIKKLDNIILMGRYPYDSMPWILSKADALVLTLANKPTFMKTVPNRLQAFMAVGKPILASANGEVARLVREAKCGFTASSESIDELYKATLKLLNLTSNERKDIGSNGRNYYLKNFNHDDLVSQLIVYFEDLIDNRS